MAYAIFRIEKIKSWGLLERASGHMNRRLPTPNADPSRFNPILVGSGEPSFDVREHISSAGLSPDKLRKNGVLAVRILATASPEFFRPDRAHAAGEWDKDRLDSWLSTTQDFLDKEFGENLVSAILHLDETTPHIDAVFVPVDRSPRKKGPEVRLNCARWLDGKAKLTALQDRYATALEPLGLERGVKGSRAKHQKIKRYYSTLHREAAAAKQASAQATIELKSIVAEREAATTERQRAKALAFSLEAYGDGRIIGATGDEQSPTFELRPMPSAEAKEIKKQLLPAWREAWTLVRNIGRTIEKRARNAARKATEMAMKEITEKVEHARAIASQAAAVAKHLSQVGRADAQLLNKKLNKFDSYDEKTRKGLQR